MSPNVEAEKPVNLTSLFVRDILDAVEFHVLKMSNNSTNVCFHWLRLSTDRVPVSGQIPKENTLTDDNQCFFFFIYDYLHPCTFSFLPLFLQRCIVELHPARIASPDVEKEE